MPLALLCVVVLTQAHSPHIKAAREAMAELKYPEAKALLQRARQQSGLSREQLVDILWMQGLVAASMSQPDAARSAFRSLFAIEPDHKPEREYPPKIMSPYYEARGWVATNKPLGFQPLPPERENGRVRRIGVKVLADPLELVTGVRIYVVGDEKHELQLKGLKASVAVDAEQVSWWAELIGEREAVLARVGDEKNPVTDVGVTPEQQQQQARVDAGDSDMPALTKPEPEPSGPPRSVSYVVGGVGAASLGLGVVFGALSLVHASALNLRARDSSGAVTTFTQREAVMLELQQRREAGTANALLAIGLIALGAAVILFLVGKP